jgi:uncharacterized membrane protein YoaK (UPF0700 family)
VTITQALMRDRHSPQSDRRLGVVLAFVAGATNAGGFLAVGQYTSHMTGMVSSIADNLILGNMRLAAAAAMSVGMFVLGAVTTSLLVSWGRRRHLRSRHALPLLIEAVLLLLFGALGASVTASVFVLPVTVALLCFLMGLQNAVITHISNAVIRTTHLTGLLTDLGIELGKLLYVNRTPTEDPVRADLQKLWLHAALINAFGIGGFAGAVGFKFLGYGVTAVLSIALFAVCWRPIAEDVRIRRRAARGAVRRAQER